MMPMDADFWNARYSAAGEGSVWGGDANRYVVEVVAPLQPGAALDFGCGEGRNALWLAEHGWQTTAIDFSSAGIDTGRRWADDRRLPIDWRVADLGSDSTKRFDEQFSLVVWCYLHLLPAPRAHAFDLAADSVRPGGMLLWIGHDRTNISDGVGGPQDPMLLSTPDEVEQELVARGLSLVHRSEVARRPVGEGDEERVALDTLVLAERPA